MLIIRFRHLTELRFDAETETYFGTVTIGYSFPDDAQITHRAMLSASAAKARHARYSWVESAILDCGVRKLMDRFAELEQLPVNIFADECQTQRRPRQAA